VALPQPPKSTGAFDAGFGVGATFGVGAAVPLRHRRVGRRWGSGQAA
jgi:hypothetical protein